MTSPMAGHYRKAGLPRTATSSSCGSMTPASTRSGQEITVADVLVKGGKADVAGVTKGKGFPGVMKRHNFAGQSASHGAHRVHRAPGSIGACATPPGCSKA